MDGILSLWQHPSVLLFLTLAVYALALLLRARTGYLLLNPVLISTVTLIAYLKILDIDYAVYHDAAQFIEQTACVGFRIVRVAIAVHRTETCGIHAGCSVECLHFQSGVVGKTIYTVAVAYVMCLLQSIAFQRIGCLRNVVVAAQLFQ